MPSTVYHPHRIHGTIAYISTCKVDFYGFSCIGKYIYPIDPMGHTPTQLRLPHFTFQASSLRLAAHVNKPQAGGVRLGGIFGGILGWPRKLGSMLTPPEN